MYYGLINSMKRGVGSSYYLDAYGTPVVWYEMVKRFSAYSGACIRVRRSSDNAEQDINFVNDLLDTASLLSFVGAGNGFVTTFYTQVGTKNVTNAVATQQPQIVSSGALITRNGFVSIKYDGTNDNLLNTTSAFINTTDVSYFSISQNDVSNGVGVIHNQDTNSNISIRSFCDRRVDKRNIVVSTISGSGIADMSIQRDNSNLRLLSAFIDASKNISSFDNGLTGGTSTYVGTPNNNGLQIGQQYLASWLNGSINCFGAYNIDNSANRVAIETILNNYYSIY
jgi:hypothetical protein